MDNTEDSAFPVAALTESFQTPLGPEMGEPERTADSVAVEQRYLKTINKEFSGICQHRHYVLGNHCVDTLTKNDAGRRFNAPRSM